MSVESDSDLLGMIDVDEFGTNILLVLGSPETEISGIFDDAHFEVDNGITVVSTSEPMAHVRSSDVAGVSQGTTIEVNGSSFTVSDIQPDGTGVTVLRLHRV